MSCNFSRVKRMKIFLHGLESSSRGAKATFFRALCPEMMIPDFRGTLSERMTALRAILAGQENIMLLGSSFGGLMATIYAMSQSDTVDRLILLAPALNFPELSNYPGRRLEIPTWMIIGKADTVTPPAEVVPVAEKIFTVLHYYEVDDDHLLARTFRKLDWESMLSGKI